MQIGLPLKKRVPQRLIKKKSRSAINDSIFPIYSLLQCYSSVGLGVLGAHGQV